MIHTSQTPLRCGIVLAGGEGTRLQPFIYRLQRKKLPKQYVNLIGTRSMLEHTWDRAEKITPPERLFTVVSGDHLKYHEARKQLFNRPMHTVVLQPMNRETGPGLLLPVTHVYRRYPQSTVAVFPSDHFILEEDLFMAHVEMGFRVVEQDPSLIVLLGMKPDQPEPDYGYILPNGNLDGLASPDIHGVKSFIEKPASQTAIKLVARGALWNSMVMVFKAKTFLSLVRAVAPVLHRSFQTIYRVIGTSAESAVVENSYQDMAASNLSKELLEVFAMKEPRHLAVLPVNGVRWSDWGSAPRIVQSLQAIGYIKHLHRTMENTAVGDGSGLDVIQLGKESLV